MLPPSASSLTLAVLVSGTGTNLQALVDAGFRVGVVVADRGGAYALERARAAGIPAVVEPRGEGLSGRLWRRCVDAGADLVVLAGFLSIVGGELLEAYAGRIINLHPSLLPRHGGPGMYGGRVHAAVLAAGDAESGCTVHVVEAGVDTGPVVVQRRVPVLPGDTVETLAERVHVEEHRAIVEAVVMMAERLGPREGAFSATVRGRVQGVGFRYSAKMEADRLGVKGFVSNTDDGDVEVWAEGTAAALDKFAEWLRAGPRWAAVRGVDLRPARPTGAYRGFVIEGY